MQHRHRRGIIFETRSSKSGHILLSLVLGLQLRYTSSWRQISLALRRSTNIVYVAVRCGEWLIKMANVFHMTSCISYLSLWKRTWWKRDCWCDGWQTEENCPQLLYKYTFEIIYPSAFPTFWIGKRFRQSLNIGYSILQIFIKRYIYNSTTNEFVDANIKTNSGGSRL